MNKVWFSFIRTVSLTMETNSPYFSPKKTRNFTKQHGLGLLQKITRTSKATELQKRDAKTIRKPEANHDRKITVGRAVKEAQQRRNKGIRSDAVLTATVDSTDKTSTSQRMNEKSPVKKEVIQTNLLAKRENKRELLDEKKHICGTEDGSAGVLDHQIKIKVEPSDELQVLNEKTPCKREGLEDRSSIKRELKEDSLFANTGKEIKWEPKNWRQTMDNIREMRRANLAPVDTMGCDQFALDIEKAIPDHIKRYHCLVSLMLSSQTKDQVNHECMMRLKNHGLTPETIAATEPAVLEKLIYPVSFYRNKTKFIKQVSQILIDQYGGDIPNSIEGLLKLPGVGKKMAHLCMRSAWNIVTGIGVDTHVHRISNWLHWVPKETKTPEDTRQALEKWLPFELWEEVNHMLVGFGQTICTSTYPRCNDCLNASICPARGKHGIRKTPIKKEVQQEDLEF